MKGTLTLVIVAVAAVWAFLFFPLDKQPKPSRLTKQEVAQDATPRPTKPVPRPNDTRTPAAIAPAANAPAVPGAPEPRPIPSASRGPKRTGDVTVIGAQHPAAAPSTPGNPPSAAPPAPFDPDTARATGELAEGVLSPDFKAAEESYVQEPRDGPWASKHEAKIREALYQSDLREDVVIVHCQSTVCRIHIQPRGGDPFAELVRVPGLAQAAGIDSSTPYSLNGSELIVYARPENAEPTR